MTSRLLFFPTKANLWYKGWSLWWLWSQTWLSSCGALGFQDWWQSMSTQFVTLASEYHHFLQLAAWKPDSALLLLVLYAHNNVSMYFFYTLWKRIESFNKYYLILYWMLLLLLSEVNNTTIFLMALLNVINRKNRWSFYMATLLSLLLAINKRPTGFVVVAQWWKTKPLDGTVTMPASISLASASAAPCEQWYVVVVSCNWQFI